MTFHVVGGVAIIYGDLPFTVHIYVQVGAPWRKRENCMRQKLKIGVF